jgi:transcription initiation factor IIE alpha subunit
MDSSSPKYHCPECDAEINFGENMEWMGPTAFLCRACKKVIELDEVRNL